MCKHTNEPDCNECELAMREAMMEIFFAALSLPDDLVKSTKE
jgi:putative ribosome biogenesis GTPase RsgA